MADVEDDAYQSQERTPKTDSISKKRLDELGQGKDAGATLTIYTRDKNRTLHVFDSKFPKDAAVLFSQTISDAVRRGDKYYIIDGEDTAGYKTVFDWIRQCRETQSDREIPEPTINDESDPFTPFLSILLAAHKLRVPTLTLQIPLLKKLLPLSRKAIIPLDLVRQIFDSFSPLNALGLQEVAATSIFEAWYTWKLEEDCYDEYMYELTDLRDGIPELDQCLHEAVEKKDAWIKERREKKRREREEAETSTGEHGGGDWSVSGEVVDPSAGTGYAGVGVSDWDNDRQDSAEMLDCTNRSKIAAHGANKGDWMAEEAVKDSEQGTWADQKNDTSSGTWADEMNDDQDARNSTHHYPPQPSASSVVW